MVGAYSYRGWAHLSKGETDKAVADCNEAIRLDPEDAKAYYNRGVVYGEIGDTDRVIADCTEAIRLDPKLGPGVSQPRRGLREEGRGTGRPLLTTPWPFT